MYLEAVCERFAQKSPVAVMPRALMENALAPAALDTVFAEHAEQQYERTLLFSSVVDLMGMVVCSDGRRAAVAADWLPGQDSHDLERAAERALYTVGVQS